MTNPYQSPPDPASESGDDDAVRALAMQDPEASDRRWIKFGLLSVVAFVVYLALPTMFPNTFWRDLVGLGLFAAGMVFAAMTAIAQADHYERFGKHGR